MAIIDQHTAMLAASSPQANPLAKPLAKPRKSKFASLFASVTSHSDPTFSSSSSSSTFHVANSNTSTSTSTSGSSDGIGGSGSGGVDQSVVNLLQVMSLPTLKQTLSEAQISAKSKLERGVINASEYRQIILQNKVVQTLSTSIRAAFFSLLTRPEVFQATVTICLSSNRP